LRLPENRIAFAHRDFGKHLSRRIVRDRKICSCVLIALPALSVTLNHPSRTNDGQRECFREIVDHRHLRQSRRRFCLSSVVNRMKQLSSHISSRKGFNCISHLESINLHPDTMSTCQAHCSNLLMLPGGALLPGPSLRPSATSAPGRSSTGQIQSRLVPVVSGFRNTRAVCTYFQSFGLWADLERNHEDGSRGVPIT
jgi:hypothetical protein